jgi:hypothetical protein
VFFFGRSVKKLCREPNKKHSAKKALPSAKKNTRQRSFLPSTKKTLGKGFFAECQSKTLGKAIFQTKFWCPKRIQIKKNQLQSFITSYDLQTLYWSFLHSTK